MQPLAELVGQYKDLGWFFLLCFILWLRHRNVWIDGPTHRATEERCAAVEGRLETYRVKLEEQAEKSAERVDTLTQVLLEDRDRK